MRPLRWPIHYLSAEPEPRFPELAFALVEDPSEGAVLPAFFTEIELAERWQAKFASYGKAVSVSSWHTPLPLREAIRACLAAGLDQAFMDPPPGVSLLQHRAHLSALLEGLDEAR